ncbi:MAG TPA: hypothetical protein VNF73_01470 [Candidatus Saccharimonadales bacterium]|nr:hypothetical protein [Candidatus Saccharimonadales bacterium]
MPAVSRTDTRRVSPPLRYLSAADVIGSMPPLEERLRLAERTMTALVAEAELPPKIGVNPRPADSFAHAMPAHLRDREPGGDLVGMKWVTGYPTNNALGAASIHGLVLLNDPATGIPIGILDGGPITAQRTAAISGVAIRHWAPPVAGRPPSAAIVGTGVQGRSHLPVIAHLLPGVELRLHDRYAERATALADEAQRLPGIGSVRTTSTAREAIEGADVVITAASFGPVRQVLTNDWLTSNALIVPVDYATYVAAEVARDADLFLVDERDQFLANRAAGLFDDYPDPNATIGEALLAGTPRPTGRVLVSHLGVGLADVVFADAILRSATAAGRGIVLPR